MPTASFVTQHAWYQGIGPGLVPFPLSVAIAKHPTNGRNVAAIGMSDGTLRILDTTVDSATPLVTSTGQSGGSIVAVNPIPRVNTSVAGGVDYAVAYQTAWSNVLAGVGGLFRWNGGTASPTLQILNQDGSPFTTDIPSFRSWFPGTKQGRLSLTNNSDEAVQVKLRSSTAGQARVLVGAELAGRRCFSRNVDHRAPHHRRQPHDRHADQR